MVRIHQGASTKSQMQPNTLAVIDEITLMESDSREMALTIRDRYPSRAIHC